MTPDKWEIRCQHDHIRLMIHNGYWQDYHRYWDAQYTEIYEVIN